MLGESKKRLVIWTSQQVQTSTDLQHQHMNQELTNPLLPLTHLGHAQKHRSGSQADSTKPALPL